MYKQHMLTCSQELTYILMHGFLFINIWLLISCDMDIYAICSCYFRYNECKPAPELSADSAYLMIKHKAHRQWKDLAQVGVRGQGQGA